MSAPLFASGPVEDPCTRCARPATRLLLLDDDTRLYVCPGCYIPALIDLTCQAVNRRA